MTTRRNFIRGILAGMTGAFLNLAGSAHVEKEPKAPASEIDEWYSKQIAFWQRRAQYWAASSDEWRRSALQHNNDLYEEHVELLKELEEAIRERDIHAEVANIWYMELRKDRDFTYGLIDHKNVRIFELEEELEERDKRLAWLDIRLEAALIDKGT